MTSLIPLQFLHITKTFNNEDGGKYNGVSGANTFKKTLNFKAINNEIKFVCAWMI